MNPLCAISGGRLNRLDDSNAPTAHSLGLNPDFRFNQVLILLLFILILVGAVTNITRTSGDVGTLRQVNHKVLLTALSRAGFHELLSVAVIQYK